MTWLVAVALLAGCVVLVLAAEISVELSLERTDTFRARWHTRWLGGLVRVSGSTRRGRSPVRSARTRSSELERRSVRRSRDGVWRAVRLLSTPGLVKRTVRLLGEALGAIAVDRFHARGSVGLGDPADTGVLYGVAAPIVAIASARGLDVSCQPEFERAGVWGSCGGRIRFRPLPVAWACARFACSAPALRAVARLWGRR